MFCSQCGSPIPNGQPVCAKCGAPTSTIGSRDAVDPNIMITETRAENKPQITSGIPLTEGETILWHRDSTRGLIHKQVTMEEAVTNKRCLRYDVSSKQIVAQVGIENMPEVVMMNMHRVNDSIGGGVFLTPRMFGLPGLPIGLYGGPRRGSIKIFGDVELMVNGNIVMTFENIKDPQGMRQLIQALKRAHLRPAARMWGAGRTGGPFQRFGSKVGAENGH